ncbi:ubiquitin-like 1-activating enzyme E1 B [Nematocida ausubeli]|nr:ubiquitin-like 1-activating enzyme E1 B [Nematocida ausubeli]
MQKGQNILLVGAGGIGSEVAHLLIKGYTGSITIVDMDKIELSNLNRQSFFTLQDISQYKAEILSRSIAALSSNAIESRFFTQDITSAFFTVEFFKKFSCILSCVDNIPARKHISRMSVLSGVPVIESGTAGYDGEVYIIFPKKTECYECREVSDAKVYPICTLRRTPTEWHHCVHWAKYDEVGNRGAEDTLESIHRISAARAVQYNIEVQDVSVTKEILDKTIPSVITTNALVANLIILQMDMLEKGVLHNIYYLDRNSIRRVKGIAPYAKCRVCGPTAHTIEIEKTTSLQDILRHLQIEVCEDTVVLKDASLIYDTEYTDLLCTPLISLGVQTGTILKVLNNEISHMIYISVNESLTACHN